MERRFLVLIRVRNQSGDKINEEIRHTPVTGGLDLGDGLELVVARFDVTVANSKIDSMPPQAGVEHLAIPEGGIQKGRRSIKEYHNHLWIREKDGKLLNEPEHTLSHSLDGIR